MDMIRKIDYKSDNTKDIFKLSVIAFMLSISSQVHSSDYGIEVETKINNDAKGPEDKDFLLATLGTIKLLEDTCSQYGWMTKDEAKLGLYINKETIKRGIKNKVFNRDTVNSLNSYSDQVLSQFDYRDKKEICVLTKAEIAPFKAKEY